MESKLFCVTVQNMAIQEVLIVGYWRSTGPLPFLYTFYIRTNDWRKFSADIQCNFCAIPLRYLLMSWNIWTDTMKKMQVPQIFGTFSFSLFFPVYLNLHPLQVSQSAVKQKFKHSLINNGLYYSVLLDKLGVIRQTSDWNIMTQKCSAGPPVTMKMTWGPDVN